MELPTQLVQEKGKEHSDLNHKWKRPYLFTVMEIFGEIPW